MAASGKPLQKRGRLVAPSRNCQTYIVDIWGGFHPPVAIIDVTHPGAVAWFKAMLREPLRLGIDVYKTDFGEGIPSDVVA